MKFTINLPINTAAVSMYLRALVKELALTAVVAGAAAGLTLLGNDIPGIAAHYGWSPLVTAQAISIVGTARAFVSGFSSVKNTVTGSGSSLPLPIPADHS